MEMLDTVVLLADLPDLDLRAGDIGAIVDVYSRDAIEVEFVGPTGATRALVTLPVKAVRKVRAADIMTVR
jgi:Domain of unknown function (DUF4926)